MHLSLHLVFKIACHQMNPSTGYLLVSILMATEMRTRLKRRMPMKPKIALLRDWWQPWISRLLPRIPKLSYKLVILRLFFWFNISSLIISCTTIYVETAAPPRERPTTGIRCPARSFVWVGESRFTVPNIRDCDCGDEFTPDCPFRLCRDCCRSRSHGGCQRHRNWSRIASFLLST